MDSAQHCHCKTANRRHGYGMRLQWHLACLLLLTQEIQAATPVLPGTRPLTVKQPIDVLIVDGLRRFCLRELDAVPAQRGRFWKRDFTSSKVYAKSIESNRARFREISGVVDDRLTALAGKGPEFKEILRLGTLTTLMIRTK